jgi:predicted RNA-binding protein associated with RNAse of E/G family
MEQDVPGRPRVHSRRESWLDTRTAIYKSPRGPAVDASEVIERDGIVYFAAPEVTNLRLSSVECWLVPSRALRVCRWTLADTPGDRDFDFYIDLCNFNISGPLYTMQDSYLDLKVWSKSKILVDDADELIAAIDAAYIPADQARAAIESAFAVAVEIASTGISVEAWLEQQGWK